jgi:beta-mannosidase
MVVELITRSLALLVEVSLIGADVIFSDNCFNLPAGRSIQISSPMPVGWTLSKVQKDIRICSVYDSFSQRAA